MALRSLPLFALAALVAGCSLFSEILTSPPAGVPPPPAPPPPTGGPSKPPQKPAGCGREGTVARLAGAPGRNPGTCPHPDLDGRPECRTGCDAEGRRHHRAHGSQNHAVNQMSSLRDAARLAAGLARHELTAGGGLWSSELGCNDQFYSVEVQFSWLAALRVAEMEGRRAEAEWISRRVFWGWALWALQASEAPRRRLTWIDPKGAKDRGAAHYAGPGLALAAPGMRWKPDQVKADDAGAALAFALDWRPRGSRFGSRPIAKPWPVLDAALHAWRRLEDPKVRISGPISYGRPIPAAAMGLARAAEEANRRRNLLTRVVRGESAAVRQLTRMAAAEKLTPGYAVYRHGLPTVGGARLLIVRTERGIESIWATRMPGKAGSDGLGQPVNGNHKVPTAYASLSAAGHYRVATPLVPRSGTAAPPGGWDVEVEPGRVRMRARQGKSGGSLTVERLGGRVLWAVEVSPAGLRVVGP